MDLHSSIATPSSTTKNIEFVTEAAGKVPPRRERRHSLPTVFSAAAGEFDRSPPLRRCQTLGTVLRDVVDSPPHDANNDCDTLPQQTLAEHVTDVSPKSSSPQVSCGARRKPTFCPNVRSTGVCRLPDCPYVHESGRAHRLMDSPSWKTMCKDVPCRFLELTGKCMNGDQCNYSHDISCILKGSEKTNSTTASNPAPRTSVRSIARTKSRLFSASVHALASALGGPAEKAALKRNIAPFRAPKNTRKGPRFVGAGSKREPARCVPDIGIVGSGGIAGPPRGLIGRADDRSDKSHTIFCVK